MKEMIENIVNNASTFIKNKKEQRRKEQQKIIRRKLGLKNPNNLNLEDCKDFIKKVNHQIETKNKELCDSKYFDAYSKLLILPACIMIAIMLSVGGVYMIPPSILLASIMTVAVSTNHCEVKRKTKELNTLYNHMKMAEKHLEDIDNKNSGSNNHNHKVELSSSRTRAVARHGRIILDNSESHTNGNGKQLVKKYRK